MDRSSGVLLPLFSLPGKYGCGTFGASAKKWIDTLAEAGFSLWQVLPFGIPDSFGSPYMSLSSFGGNPAFIDPEALCEEGLVTAAELREQEEAYPYLCDWAAIRQKRKALFQKAAARVTDRAPIERFFREHPELDQACRFFALREQNGEKAWHEWTAKEPDEELLFYWKFVQYEFHRQWDFVHSYAKKRGVEILGDLPIYTSLQSFDVYSDPASFQLNEKGYPIAVAGVPPDYFAPEGQYWGNPLYDWDHLEKTGYAFWKRRLAYQLWLFDGIRLDHFRAFSEYWAIRADSNRAADGEWKKGPGMKLLNALKEVAAGKRMLAEDLGFNGENAQKLLKKIGYPGMAVFQFGFDDDWDSPHLPHNYGENLAAYTGTHDNNTLLGFWMELDDQKRRKVLDYLGDPEDACAAALRAVWMSRASLAVFPMQDLLGYGADTRINTPGIAEGNWRCRFTEHQIASADWKKYALWNRIYSRAPVTKETH